MIRFLLTITVVLASIGSSGVASARAARMAPAETPGVFAPTQQQSGRVLMLDGDVSGSTTTTDPAGILNSLLPAAAYASAASRTYMATFGAEVGPPREVEAADEHSLQGLEAELKNTPRGGATATTPAVACCMASCRCSQSGEGLRLALSHVAELTCQQHHIQTDV